MDTVCTIRTISLQLNPTDQGVLEKESSKDPAIANVIWCTREGWPPKVSSMKIQRDYSIEDFQKLSDSFSAAHGRLLYGSRVVIPPSLQCKVLH